MSDNLQITESGHVVATRAAMAALDGTPGLVA